MSYPYQCCGRQFNGNGMRNHLDNSRDHWNEIECRWCFSRWPTHEGNARKQHEKNNHWPRCKQCNFMCSDQDDMDDHIEEEHPPNYCYGCQRQFTNLNNLNMHLKSSVHQGKNVKCPWCPNMYTNLAGVCLHLESSSCQSGINRQAIDQYCRQVDRNHVFTTKLIGWHNDDDATEHIATEASWHNGWYRCFFCDRGFARLFSLNQHLASPVHRQKIYRCPRCNLEYKVLSSLVNHLESETCGAFRFQKTGNVLTFANQLTLCQ